MHLKTKARQLRKNQTDAERLLWSYLRNRGLANFKFRRQHTIGRFIVDLVCLERGVVIEVDGGQHSVTTDHDDGRTAFLVSRGFRVLRFWNNQVLAETEGVLGEILGALEDPHPGPLPGGERE